MSTASELIFEFTPNGKATGTTITTRLGEEVVHCDKGDPAKSRFRDDYVNTVCKSRPGINRADVERLLLMQAAEFTSRQERDKDVQVAPGADDLLQRMPEHVRLEARAMLESPDLLQRTLDDISATGVAGERELVAAVYIVGTSRLLSRPLAAIVQGPSSSGKSHAVAKTADKFPPEAVINATSMTPQALFYMEPGSLRHRWIVAGERSRVEDDDTAEATRALREMISGGRLTKIIPVKDNGRIVTQTIDQEGPVAFIETTTLTKVFEEDANRCLLLASDERTKQTEAIVKRLAEGFERPQTAQTDAIIQRHHAIQRILQKRDVIIPFAEQVAEHFPTDRIEARGAFPQFMGVIQASALLHQFQRKLDGDGRILANPDDYQLARHLTRGPLARSLGGRLPDAAMRFHERLCDWASGDFSTTDAAKRDRKAKQTINAWLGELADAGAVTQLEVGKGRKPSIWRLTALDSRDLLAGEIDLPDSLESL